ncbi:MAG: lysophospholipid acyltransferase family protein [Pirellulales bacterium]
MRLFLGISLAVLLSLVVMAGAVIVRFMWRYSLPFSKALLYFLNVTLTRFLWRTTVEGSIELTPGMGAVIISNHRSSIDTLFLQQLIPRAIHYLIAREFVERRFIGWPLRVAGAIPVNRGGIDTAATKQAIRLAQAGEMIGIFPEGRINTTHEFMLPGRRGAALIALRARVPVIPCYVEGSPYGGHILRPFITPARVTVRIGKPIDVTEYIGREDEDGVLEEMTLRFLREIARLAGQENFEPRTAGRRWKTEEGDEVVTNGEE